MGERSGPATYGHSVGDALIVAALLLFAAAWFASASLGLDHEDTKDLSTVGTINLLIVIFGPPVWAMATVGRLVSSHKGSADAR